MHILPDGVLNPPVLGSLLGTYTLICLRYHISFLYESVLWFSIHFFVLFRSFFMCFCLWNREGVYIYIWKVKTGILFEWKQLTVEEMIEFYQYSLDNETINAPNYNRYLTINMDFTLNT